MTLFWSLIFFVTCQSLSARLIELDHPDFGDRLEESFNHNGTFFLPKIWTDVSNGEYDLHVGKEQNGERVDYNGTLSLPKEWAKPGELGLFRFDNKQCTISRIQVINAATNSPKQKVVLLNGGPGRNRALLFLGIVPRDTVTFQFIVYVKPNDPEDGCKGKAILLSSKLLHDYRKKTDNAEVVRVVAKMIKEVDGADVAPKVEAPPMISKIISFFG